MVLENLEGLGTDQIENLRIERLKKVQEYRNNKSKIKDGLFDVKRQIVDLTKKRDDLNDAIRKCNQVIEEAEAEIEILRSKYWEKRN